MFVIERFNIKRSSKHFKSDEEARKKTKQLQVRIESSQWGRSRSKVDIPLREEEDEQVNMSFFIWNDPIYDDLVKLVLELLKFISELVFDLGDMWFNGWN